jgi:hypothetical protein
VKIKKEKPLQFNPKPERMFQDNTAIQQIDNSILSTVIDLLYSEIAQLKNEGDLEIDLDAQLGILNIEVALGKILTECEKVHTDALYASTALYELNELKNDTIYAKVKNCCKIAIFAIME